MDAINHTQLASDFFIEYLIVATHQILWHREIHSRTSSSKAKKYNYPLYQSRSEILYDWINTAAASVKEELSTGRIKWVVIVIALQGTPKEQFIFDITQFSANISKVTQEMQVIEQFSNATEDFPLVDAEEQVRAMLSRLDHRCSSMEALPDQRTFTLGMQVDSVSTLTSSNARLWDQLLSYASPDSVPIGQNFAPDESTTRIWVL